MAISPVPEDSLQTGADVRDVAWHAGGQEEPGGGERLRIDVPASITAPIR